jgi:FMN-dependent NADH-azoreductase
MEQIIAIFYPIRQCLNRFIVHNPQGGNTMKTLLHIQSSMFGDEGQSSQLASGFTQSWLQQYPGSRVLRRDLSAQPVPHLDLTRFQSFITPAADRTAAQRSVDEYSLGLIEELRSADVIVFGVPMYNFSVPSVLHAWFDHVARAGITFRYTASGAEGLLKGKKAYVFITRGGLYGEDHFQTGYLRTFLGFIGITDVEFVHAEGLAMPEVKEQKLAQARQQRDILLAA